jgi:hypothetical protein
MKKTTNLGEATNVVVKKRGRKPKKGIEESNKEKLEQENIVVVIEEQNQISNQNNIDSIDDILNSNNLDENENEVIQSCNLDDKPVSKKRGRKPKGGKIVQQVIHSLNIKETKPNVILHLKCSINDLNSSNLLNEELEGFSFNSNSLCYLSSENNQNNQNKYIASNDKLFEYENDNCECDYDSSKIKENDVRDVWKKLKILEHSLHNNNIDNKKSACFWDTCEFDNPPVYIPKHFINNTYNVYGCFCSPECAVAHLMEENIDSSIKFERYQLINYIYSKIYNYNKNIKPAPNPYYMLEKYYGNLSIQEFRSLLQNERLFLIVDKPLTRIMPELHEDNDDFIINNKIIPSNTYQIKKSLQRKQTKNNILSERFGFTSVK